MLSTLSSKKSKMHTVQTNLCIQLSYLEDQRNLSIYNKNDLKKKNQLIVLAMHPSSHGSLKEFIKGHLLCNMSER